MSITSPRASAKGYRPPSVDSEDEADHRKQLALSIADLMMGKRNVNREVTLTANAASTTVTDPRIGATTVLHLTPKTANAAAAMGTTYQTYPNATSEQAVINHANNAQSDKTFVVSFDG